MRQLLAITRKELNGYFGSPMALIFIGVFLAATLFSFFWIDTFFRGIADVRPLFRWMPLLLIFLVAALTMRQWSTESQTGTLEILLTLPVNPWQLVLGKFLAVLTLVALALAITLALPVTVASLGNLDWGPVIGGYLAALLLASAFAALGLFISSLTNNDIVALILTSLAGAVLYLLGTRTVTEFAGESVGSILRAVATGSRFESIERGVIDLRDLVYYLSLTGIFLTLNVIALDAKRWSRSRATAGYRRNSVLATVLIVLNLVALNVWLFPQNSVRLDLTQQREYTLSATSEDMLESLQEPLLIRAFFSERTHPLLSPLVPAITDMLREYEVAGGGKVQVEIIDPATNPELEAEADQTYGIRPSPFQIAGRYEESVVNAYFDLLFRYGDQSETLNFSDLIEVESFHDGDIDVRLRNLEYDLTRTIKKVVFGFQDTDSILAALPGPAQLTLFTSPETIPAELQAATDTIAQVAGEMAAESNGKFTFQTVNPTDPNSGVDQQMLYDRYGIQPFSADLFGSTTYYLHMLLEAGEEGTVIYPSGDLSETEVRQGIESGLKRFSSGFLKVIGLWRPVIAPDPTMAQFGQTQPGPFSTWDTLEQRLSQDYEVRPLDLTTGQVPPDIDVLLVVAPQGMSDVSRYAIDQYLMRGGAVVVVGSNYRVSADPFTGGLALTEITDGLRDMLLHYGVDVQQTMVLDPQNEPFPVPVQREVNGFQVQELQSLNYPYFVDVRSDGMSKESPIIASLPAVTLNWVSPVRLDDAKTANLEKVTLLTSSPDSWLRSDLDIQPNTNLYPELGFPQGDQRGASPLAVSLRGAFPSYFAGKESPLATLQADPQNPAPLPSTATIAQSPDTARLVVVGSGDFLNDTVFQISSQLSAERFLNSLQLVQNTVDWSAEDLDLLQIRARGTRARVLEPVSVDDQSFWEFANYAFAFLALLLIAGVWAIRRRSEKPMRLDDTYAPTSDTPGSNVPGSDTPNSDVEVSLERA